jgi:hypothetical protein
VRFSPTVAAVVAVQLPVDERESTRMLAAEAGSAPSPSEVLMAA